MLNSLGPHAACWIQAWRHLPACGRDCQKPSSARFPSPAAGAARLVGTASQTWCQLWLSLGTHELMCVASTFYIPHRCKNGMQFNGVAMGALQSHITEIITPWPQSLMFNLAMVKLKMNSLQPSDTIWWHWTGTTLALVMACMMAASHYLNQCQLVIQS